MENQVEYLREVHKAHIEWLLVLVNDTQTDKQTTLHATSLATGRIYVLCEGDAA